jgi:hypothetical protein
MCGHKSISKQNKNKNKNNDAKIYIYKNYINKNTNVKPYSKHVLINLDKHHKYIPSTYQSTPNILS